MVEEGLKVPDVGHATREIQHMDLELPSSRVTLRKFLEKYEGGEKFFHIGEREVYEKFPSPFPLKPMERVIEVLDRLRKRHSVAIVTAGIRDRQIAKMKKAGIEPSLFSKIIVCEGNKKKAHYQALAEEFQMLPKEVMVCGDRIEADLLPAKDLGYTSVHIRQGRGKNEPHDHPSVDYSIDELYEIISLVEEI